MTTAAQDPNPNIFERIRRWKSGIPWLAVRVPARFIFPLFSICLGARYLDGWGGRVGFWRADTQSLFYNGGFFLRVIFCPLWALPTATIWFLCDQLFGGISHGWLLLCIGFVGVGIRWSGKNPTAREFLQTYIGPKLNGEWAVVPRFRIQSDLSASNGTTGPNYGQAIGWDAGTK